MNNALLHLKSFLLLILCTGMTHLSMAQAYITTWKTDNTGTSSDTQITIPGTGTYSIAWVEVGNAGHFGSIAGSGTTTVEFGSAGTYQVSITGTLTQILFNNGGDRLKILTIEAWGTIAWTSMISAYSGCSNLTYNATDAPVLTSVTDCSAMFVNASAFNGDLSGWDVSSVTNMSGMFQGASAFNGNITTWDVSSVTNMSSMFRTAAAFNQNISGWNVSSVTSMGAMFRQASAFNQDISSWNVSSVTDMSVMFSSAIAFNQNLNSWNVSSVTNMTNMFINASAFNGNISSWIVSSATSTSGMFQGASAFNQNISGWVVTSVTNMFNMFSGATAFNQDISGWNVTNVTNMSGMFTNASTFNQPIGSWTVTGVTTMASMFSGASAFNGNISSWTVTSVTDMGSMFRSAAAFNQPIGSWNVSSVTNMGSMFRQASAFNQDISSWAVSNVIFMSLMFSSAVAFNQDITGWTVTSVTTMERMLQSASAFNQNLGSWNVSNVTNMISMLENSGLSFTNYDNTLIGWSALTLQASVAFGATGLDYCNGEAARLVLTSAPNNWTISGDVLNCALPVELSWFKGQGTSAGNLLTWQTATELNNEGFEIQRAAGNAALAAGRWEVLAFVAGHGSTNEIQNYSYTDERPQAGLNYYRLKQIDFDGKFEFSDIVLVEVRGDGEGSGGGIQIFPNPAPSGELTLYLPETNEGKAIIRLYDQTGRLALQQTTTSQQERLNVSQLAAGIYFVEVMVGGKVFREKVVVE